MPEILHRCVDQVMAKGHSESSAYAICRTSLGLQTDGSEDDKEDVISYEDMQRRVETVMSFQNGPIIRKTMTVLHPLGYFKNGPDEGVVDKDRIANIVANFSAHPRQVPIFMLGDHPERNDERMPVGWVEGAQQNADGNLVLDTKLMGEGATAVINDLIRGASVYTTQAKDYDGTPIGECLKHLLLTNEPYDKEVNLAASKYGGSEVAALAFTASFKEGSTMPKPDPEKKELSLQEVETKHAADLKLKDDEIVRLKAENLGLHEQLDNIKPDEDKERLALRVASLERKTEAQEIREIVSKGLRLGTLKPSWCKGYNEKGDEGTLSWFAASRFAGEKKLLSYQVDKTDPVIRYSASAQTGQPADGGRPQMSSEEKAELRARGIDPDKHEIAATVVQSGGDLTTYRRLKAVAKEN